MMAYEMDMTGIGSEDEITGFDAVPPGIYHVMVVEVDEETYRDRGKFVVKFEVLDGNKPAKGKQFSHFFVYPSASHKDGGTFCNKILMRLAVKTDLMKPGQKGYIDWQNLNMKQLVVAVENTVSEGKTYAGVATSGTTLGISSLNDPEVATVPKNQDAIDLAKLGKPPTQAAQPSSKKEEYHDAF